MTRLYIVGGGGFGAEVAMLADVLIAQGGAPFTEHRFLDDDPSYLRERGMGAAVAGPIQDHRVDPDALYVCAIGNPLTRRYICDKLEQNGARFATLIHPISQIAPSAEIGHGSILSFSTGLFSFSRIGKHVHINAHSGLGHDATLGDYVTLSGFVDITGHVAVGEGAFFGTHSAVLPGHKIGAWARIGAGCVVSRSVRSEAILYGEPPKFLNRGKV